MANYSGVLPLYRSDFKNFKNYKDAEWRLRQAIICLMGWDDYYHPENYGKADTTQKELADYLGWKEGKVSKRLKTLLKKEPGFYRDVGGVFVFPKPEFDRFKTKVAFALEKERVRREKEAARRRYQEEAVSKMKPAVPELKEEVSELKGETEEHPATTPLTEPKALVSFKGSYFSNHSSREEKRQAMIEQGFSPASLDDDGHCRICHSNQTFADCCAWRLK